MTDVKDVQRALLEEAAEYYSKIWATRDKSEREKFGDLRKAKQFEAALLEPVINEDNILSTLFWVDSENRWELFELICDKYDLTPKAFAIGLKDAWSTGIGTGSPKVFSFFRRVDRTLMMDEEEQQYYDALPDKVTLYRGCDINELNYLKDDCADDNDGSCLGISWTTDRGVAEFFAFRYDIEDRVVVSIEVEKSSIVTFINDRNEYECIILDIDSLAPQIVTYEPTEFYEEFIEKTEKQSLI